MSAPQQPGSRDDEAQRRTGADAHDGGRHSTSGDGVPTEVAPPTSDATQVISSALDPDTGASPGGQGSGGQGSGGHDVGAPRGGGSHVAGSRPEDADATQAVSTGSGGSSATPSPQHGGYSPPGGFPGQGPQGHPAPGQPGQPGQQGQYGRPPGGPSGAPGHGGQPGWPSAEPPRQPSGYGPPQPGGYGGPQGGQPGGYGAPQPGGYGPPQPGGYGAPQGGQPGAYGGQQGAYGRPPQPGFGQQGQYGQPPQSQQWGGPPQHGQYGSPSDQGQYGAYGAQSGHGAAAGPLAEWPQRAVGGLIDYVAPLGGAFVLNFLLTALFDNVVFALIGWLAYLAALGFVLWNSYQGGITGQTIGRKKAGVKLVGEQSGQPIGGGMGIARSFCHILDHAACFIGWLAPLFTAKKQTFADMVLKTLVVRVDR